MWGQIKRLWDQPCGEAALTFSLLPSLCLADVPLSNALIIWVRFLWAFTEYLWDPAIKDYPGITDSCVQIYTFLLWRSDVMNWTINIFFSLLSLTMQSSYLHCAIRWFSAQVFCFFCFQVHCVWRLTAVNFSFSLTLNLCLNIFFISMFY